MQYSSHSLPISLASPAYSAPEQRVDVSSQVHAITNLELIFTTLALLFLTEPLIMLFRQEDPRYGMDYESGDLFTQIILFGMYAATVYFMRRSNLSLSLLFKNKLVLSLLVLSALSAIWSEVPEIVLRRTVALIGTTLFGVYFGLRYNLSQQLRLLAAALGIAALASLSFVILFPQFGISRDLDVHAGTWRGIYVNKNVLARVMALGSSVFLILGLSEQRLVRWGGFALCMGLLAMSTSMTGAIVAVGVACLIALYWMIGRPYFVGNPGSIKPFVILALMVALLAGTALAMNLPDLLKAINRDPTLTGRTELWSAVADMISDRPLLGYGYASFWREEQGPSLAVWRRVHWAAPNAHNGFLELALDLGYIGVGIFAISWLSTLGKALNRMTLRHNWESFWPFLFVVFLLLYNLTEASLVRRNNILWVLYVAVAYRLSSATSTEEVQ